MKSTIICYRKKGGVRKKKKLTYKSEDQQNSDSTISIPLISRLVS